jgi:CO dehydrogenase maturation factor
MKIALTGKGGVGKSTISALFSRMLSERGNTVLSVDADPDMNLADILGVPSEIEITPIVQLKDLIAERTETTPGQPAPFFKMNPKVSDIPEKYCVRHRGINLLVMGTVRHGGGGCACPENAFLKQLLSHLVIYRKEWLVMDMEAGIEHLGRGTAIGVDEMFMVVEPSKTSLETAYRIQKLSNDLGIKKLRLIGNKIQGQQDKDFLLGNARDLEFLGFLDYSDEVRDVSLGRISAFELSGEPISQINVMLDKIS